MLQQIIEKGGIIMFNIAGLESGLNNNNQDCNDKKELSKQIHFLLCESCFWCASYLSSKSVSVVKCPNCYNNKIERLPISKSDPDKLTKEGDAAPYYTAQVNR
jgi:predicted RNA-binding Zn-ribbon protein involved in translation (DUF1610 family)